jgi:CRP-like cAMP-binding protein
MSPEALQYLSSQSYHMDLHRGDIVFREGTPGDSLYLLSLGEVEVVQQLDLCDETTLATLQAPDFFGEMSLLDKQPRSASIRVVEDCELDVISETELRHLSQFHSEQYSVLVLNMARDLARRLRQLNREFVHRSGRTPPVWKQPAF